MPRVDFLEVVSMYENGGTSDEWYLFIDFELDHIFIILEFNLVDKM